MGTDVKKARRNQAEEARKAADRFIAELVHSDKSDEEKISILKSYKITADVNDATRESLKFIMETYLPKAEFEVFLQVWSTRVIPDITKVILDKYEGKTIDINLDDYMANFPLEETEEAKEDAKEETDSTSEGSAETSNGAEQQ